jgi:uncharacterized protein YegL
MTTSKNALRDLFAAARSAGTLSQGTSTMLMGNVGQVVIAGAAGMDAEDIVASDVHLITLLIDASSSIGSAGLEQAVRDGQQLLLDAVAKTAEADSLLVALWTFNHEQKVVHAYVPLKDAARLNKRNYCSGGTTRLYDTWCDGLAANLAYAERLRQSGTPCRSTVVVITDGEDVGSCRSAQDCACLSKELLATEQFILAFVGVGNEIDFRRVAREMGVPERCIAVQRDATPQGLRQVFQLVSQSAIRASQGLIAPGANAGFFG